MTGNIRQAPKLPLFAGERTSGCSNGSGRILQGKQVEHALTWEK
jgi:hypothetical protein